MKGKAQLFAGIGGLLGVLISVISAASKFNLSVTEQMQQAVGYVIAGLGVGAVLGYIIGKSMDK